MSWVHKKDSLTFIFTKTEQIEPNSGYEFKSKNTITNNDPSQRNQRQQSIIKTETRSAGLVLLHSNPNSQIIASDQQEYYENYYTWRQVIKNGMRDVRFQFDSNRMANEYYELLYK